MELLVLAVLLVGLILFTAYPLLEERFDFEEVAAFRGSKRLRLIEEKDTIISNLKDLEMDFEMGKLDRGDYLTLKNRFERRAVELFRKLDHRSSG